MHNTITYLLNIGSCWNNCFAKSGLFKFNAAPLIVHGIVDRLHDEVKATIPAGSKFFIYFIASLILKPQHLKEISGTNYYIDKKSNKYNTNIL
jgi:hypothetical protein